MHIFRIWLVGLALLLPVMARAFEVTPLYLEMTAGGKGATATLTVENTTPRQLALEAEAIRREISPKGEETRQADEDSFLIFPPQAIVPPGKTQVFRLQWLGAADLAVSRSFYIMLKQLPVNFAADPASGITFLTNIGASVHVLPTASKNAGQIEDVRVTDKNGKPHLACIVRNTGNRLFYTDTPRYRISSPDLPHVIEIDGETIRKTEQTELITPGGGRPLLLPLPQGVRAATVTLVFP